MEQEKLSKILDDHGLWLSGQGGMRANLSGADLRGADLREADLREADLREADLREADLSGSNLSRSDLPEADLREADLSMADLPEADLRGADLREADLREADLRGSNLSGSKLTGAKLRGSKLTGAKLRGADFKEANITKTCLDPQNIPNQGNYDLFQQEDNRLIGYRTKNSPYMNTAPYEVGQTYIAPVFSTSHTPCHPGLFVLPTIKRAMEWGDKLIKVKFDQDDLHQAGDKWRVKRFTVMEEINILLEI